jgi:hypothetical protein
MGTRPQASARGTMIAAHTQVERTKVKHFVSECMQNLGAFGDSPHAVATPLSVKKNS